MLEDDEGWGPKSSRGFEHLVLRFDRAVEWLKSHERSVLVAAVALQVLLLLGMIGSRAAVLRSGRTVLLRVVPVDPRDLIRGDYVTLGYEISQVAPIPTVPGSASWSTGGDVYVTLVPEPDGRHYRKGAVSQDRPPPNVTFIKGTLVSPMRVRFGIESYYVQEGKGRDYEQAIQSRRLWAEVALAPDGTAVLRGLVIE
jgi:uncharacterized membrane-anchored protein